MKASKVIERIQQQIDEHGDLDLLIAGHPGEIGLSPDKSSIFTRGKEVGVKRVYHNGSIQWKYGKSEEKYIFIYI